MKHGEEQQTRHQTKSRQNAARCNSGHLPGVTLLPVYSEVFFPVASHPANNQASPALARASLFFPLYFSTLFPPSKLPGRALGLGKVWLATDYVVSIVSA